MPYVDPNKPVQHVAIVRALPGLGDLLCIIPAWRALRAALPHAQIALIGLPGMRWVAERFHHYIDEVVALPGFPGLSEQPPAVDQLPAFFGAMQVRRFDWAIQMHGSGTITNPLTMLLGAQATAGFYVPGHYCPDAERFLPYPAHEHEVRRNLQVIEHIRVPAQGEQSEWPVLEKDGKRCTPSMLCAICSRMRTCASMPVPAHRHGGGCRSSLRQWPMRWLGTGYRSC